MLVESASSGSAFISPSARDAGTHVYVGKDELQVELPLAAEALHRGAQLAPQPPQVVPVKVVQIHIIRQLHCSWRHVGACRETCLAKK